MSRWHVMMMLWALTVLHAGCDELQPQQRGCGDDVVLRCQCGDGSWSTMSCVAGTPVCPCNSGWHDDGLPATDSVLGPGWSDGVGGPGPDALVASDAGAPPAQAPDSGSTASGPGSITGPAKILCLGDSITASKNSWIFPLQDLMRKDGCSYRLIGLDHEPYDGKFATKPGYDHLRVAVGGFSSRGVLNWVKEQGTGGTPDIIIEYLGVNNVWGGYIDGKYNPSVQSDPGGAFVQDMGELLSMVRAENPQVSMILTEIQDNKLPQISSAINQAVAQHNQASSPLLVAGSAMGVATSDGIHPTTAGAAVLAAKIYETLGPLLKSHQLCN